jgi:hypothetical protein
MGDCIYCGRAAGFFHNKHNECAQQHEEGKRQIVAMISSAASSLTSGDGLYDQVRHIASNSYIRGDEELVLALTGLSTALTTLLHDNVLSEEAEDRLLAVKDAFSISRKDLERSGIWINLVKCAVIRDVLRGNIPRRFAVDGSIPIVLQKSEEIIWLFNQVRYLEDRTRREIRWGHPWL